MKITIAFVIGAVFGILLSIMAIRIPVKHVKKKRKISLNTYSKVITTAAIVHGMILTSCSYLLSAFGLEPVADVSSTIVQEIIAPVIVYLSTNMIMNIFEKNKLSFSVPLNSTVVTRDGEKISSNSSDGAVG